MTLLCDEPDCGRAATQTTEAPWWWPVGTPRPAPIHNCDNCAEAAHQRQVEAAMEG